MKTCVRCGLQFAEFGDRATPSSGLCGICRIAARGEDGQRSRRIAESGARYAEVHGYTPPRRTIP